MNKFPEKEFNEITNKISDFCVKERIPALLGMSAMMKIALPGMFFYLVDKLEEDPKDAIVQVKKLCCDLLDNINVEYIRENKKELIKEFRENYEARQKRLDEA